MRARVGALMPLPPKASSQQHDQLPQVQGGNRVRVHSGMSLEVSLHAAHSDHDDEHLRTYQSPWMLLQIIDRP